MKSAEYSVVSNRVAVSCALAALRNICPDDEGDVSQEELQVITKPLAELEQKLFKKIDTFGETE